MLATRSSVNLEARLAFNSNTIEDTITPAAGVVAVPTVSTAVVSGGGGGAAAAAGAAGAAGAVVIVGVGVGVGVGGGSVPASAELVAAPVVNAAALVGGLADSAEVVAMVEALTEGISC